MRQVLLKTLASCGLLFFLPVVNAADKNANSLPVETINTGSVFQMFFGLLVIVGLILGVAWFMRRMGQFTGHASSNMKIIAGMSVGQRERILLLQVGEKQILVGCTPGSIRNLQSFDEPVITASDSSAQPSFAERLNAVLKKER